MLLRMLASRMHALPRSLTLGPTRVLHGNVLDGNPFRVVYPQQERSKGFRLVMRVARRAKPVSAPILPPYFTLRIDNAASSDGNVVPSVNVQKGRHLLRCTALRGFWAVRTLIHDGTIGNAHVSIHLGVGACSPRMGRVLLLGWCCCCIHQQRLWVALFLSNVFEENMRAAYSTEWPCIGVCYGLDCRTRFDPRDAAVAPQLEWASKIHVPSREQHCLRYGTILDDQRTRMLLCGSGCGCAGCIRTEDCRRVVGISVADSTIIKHIEGNGCCWRSQHADEQHGLQCHTILVDTRGHGREAVREGATETRRACARERGEREE